MDYLSYKDVCGWTRLKYEDLADLLIAKKFPLPVKSGEGKVVFHKDEIVKWLRKHQPNALKGAKNARTNN